MQRAVRRASARALFQRRYAGGVNPKQAGVPETYVRTDAGLVSSAPVIDEGLRTSQLDNGVKVVTKDNGGSIAQLTFLYKDGPVYENIFNSGISGFMAHALSKDSVTSSEFITKSSLQKAGISVAVPKIVNKSYIAYTTEGTRESLSQPAVMDKFWQSLLFPRFSAASITECRRLITLENTELKRDTPFVYLQDVLHKAAFRGSPLGHTSVVPGYNMGVNSDELFDRWDAHYGFDNIAVVATNMEHNEVLNCLTSTPWLARAHQKVGGVAAPASIYTGGEVYDVCHRAKEFDDQFVDVTNTYTAYAFKAPGRASLKDHAAATVVANALNSAVSPVLNNGFSPKRLEVFYKAYDSVGLLGLTTIAATKAQLAGFKAALANVGAVTDADLAMHKSAALLKALDTADSWRGTQALLVDTYTTGDPVCPSEMAAAIGAVTAADVKKVVDAALASPASLAHYGNSPSAPALADL